VTIFWDVAVKNIVPAEGVRPLLEDLARMYTLFVASDEFLRPLMHKLQHVVGSIDLFAALVTPELTRTMKPSMAYYNYILEQYDVPPSSFMMVGDSWYRDLEQAKPLGLKTVLVAEEKDGAPHYWIRSLSDVDRILTIEKGKS
jgi:FMN phosphatase YigB (HAD superfamily)